MRLSDFTSNWQILMTNVKNDFVTTTTTLLDDEYEGKTASSEIAISFSSCMQKGIVDLELETGTSSSSLSDNSSESSSSSIDSNSTSSCTCY